MPRLMVGYPCSWMVDSRVERLESLIFPGWRSSSGFSSWRCTHTSEFYLSVFIFLMKYKCLDAFKCTNLISCWHNGHHGELVHADLGHSHRSQQTDLWRTHVRSFGQHTLPSPDVMSYWPIHTHIHTPVIMSNFWGIIIFIVDRLECRVLPDVLSGPGLHHDPHLQLLCALQQSRQLTAW